MEPIYNPKHISGRTLRMPGLKPSDYFLFKQCREYFHLDMRKMFTVGLRLIYTVMLNPSLRANLLLPLIEQVHNENLDIQELEVTYERFIDIK